MEDGGTSSAAVVINDLREIIAKISDSHLSMMKKKKNRVSKTKS